MDRRTQEEEGGEENTMEEEVKTMRDGREADILQINVVLNELLQRLESFVSLLHREEKQEEEEEEKHASGLSFVSLLHIKEKMHPSLLLLELRALQRTLFILHDFVDVETSLEKRVIDHLELGKLGVVIFKDDQVAMPTSTWLRVIRVVLNDTILALEKIYAQISLSQAQGLSYFFDPHAHTRILSCISPHTRQLANLISLRTPLEPQRIETPQLAESSSFNANDVYGREEDKQKVIESLLSDLGKSTTSSSSSCSEDIIHVMSIVGGPGVGKTTLAKLVYNDERIDNCFDMKMWVNMSNCYSDIIRTTKSFVEAATMATVGCYYSDIIRTPKSFVLDHLQPLLEKLLKGKKFFLVLDGVSNEICCDWEVLRVPFRVGAANGSRILITSRSSMVSSRLGTISSYTLGPLLYEDCCSLVRNLTFGKNSGTAASTSCPPSPELSQHIEKIAEQLKGFPSLAVALGTFLHSIPHEDKLQIARKMILSNDASAPPLSISSTMLWAYHSLSSPQLKQCFVFCGLFRKRYRFKKSKLIKLWMAEGFLQTTKESDTRMEDLGVSYLEELMERSLFQHPRGSTYFMLPDAVHDLAQHIFTN